MQSQPLMNARLTIVMLFAFTMIACDQRPTPSPTTQAESPTSAAHSDDSSENGNVQLPTPSDAPVPPKTESATDSVPMIDGIPSPDLSHLSENLQARIEAVQKACRDAPGSSDKVEQLARAYASVDANAAAAACFDRASEMLPGKFSFPYIAGLLHAQIGNAEAAKRAFDKAVTIDPEYAAIHVHLGLLALPENAQAANSHFENATKLDPTDAVAWWGLGKCAQERGDHSSAVEHLQKAVDIDPNYRDAQSDLAKSYRAIGKDEAAKTAENAAKSGVNATITNDPIFLAFQRDSSSDEEIVQIALNRARAGDVIRSIQFLGTLVKAGRDGVEIRRGLGMLFLDLGETSQAIAEFKRAIEFSPKTADLHSLLGMAYIESGRLDAAESSLADAASIAPDDSETLSAVAVLRLAQGNADESERLFKNLIEKSPDDANLQYRASKASIALGDLDTAKKRLDVCIRLQPDHAPARYMLAMIQLQSGDRSACIDNLKHIVNAGSTFPDAYVAFAALAEDSAGERMAVQVLRSGLAKNPRSAKLANALAWLFATSPDAEIRNPENALKLSAQACSLAKQQSHEYLDTLAVAQAANGTFELATNTMIQAIQLAESSGVADDKLDRYRERLKLFENNKVFVRSAP